MFINQQTLIDSITFSGIGLHTGKSVKVKIFPEKVNSGINFIFGKEKIKASWKNAQISQLCTKIKKKNFYISTIEHLMSALSATGVTNASIQTTSEEIPILDGSAKDFVEKILNIGVVNQKVPQKIIQINKKVSYSINDKYIEITPNKKKLTIDYSIDYKDDFIKKQSLYYEHNLDNFKDIYLARTFCLHRDLEKIFAMGLAKGGTLDNAIVVSGKKILNQGGLRYKDEFVRHKILDCIGDLYLAEYQIVGNIKTFGGGHEINLMLLYEIFKDNSNFEILG